MHRYATIFAVFALTAIACTTQTEIQEVEVTREVTVMQEVPVTVQTVRDVEITREVPVTVETVRNVEVTREVVTTEQVEVTREVPVTRLVEVVPTQPVEQSTLATAPTPNLANGTPEPTITADTPTPEPTVVATITPTPEPALVKIFGSWSMRPDLAQFGQTKVAYFENAAQKWEAGVDAPMLVYECDSRQQRAMYIDWDIALSTQISYFPRYTDDPFRQYRDEDLDALADMADKLLAFVEEAEINRASVGELEQMWKTLRRHWDIDPVEAAELVERMKERNHRSVLVASEFYIHRKDHPASLEHGPTYVNEITGTWVMLPGHRTQMDTGDLGSLRRLYRDLEDAAPPGSKMDRLLIAEVKEPTQIGSIMAEWEITGLDKVIDHCYSIRN